MDNGKCSYSLTLHWEVVAWNRLRDIQKFADGADYQPIKTTGDGTAVLHRQHTSDLAVHYYHDFVLINKLSNWS